APVTPVPVHSVAPAAKVSPQSGRAAVGQPERLEQFSITAHIDGDELAAAGRDNLDAYMAAGQAWAAGMGAIGHELAQIAWQVVDAQLTATQALMTAKSVDEVLNLQANHSYSATELFLSESGRLAELTAEVAGQTAAPLQSRATASIEQWMPKID
ncbi:MAG: phasin family protein, partial [Pseudomonadota bacterium]